MRAGSRLTAQLTGGIYLYFQKAYLQIISYPNLWEDRGDYNRSIPLRKNGKKKETQKQRVWIENDNYKSKYSKLRGDEGGY
jgi:hypothetical protein